MGESQAPVVLAMTGASGAAYGLRLLECLLQARHPVALMISKAALMVIATETDLAVPGKVEAARQYLCQRFGVDASLLQVYDKEQWLAPVASGSARMGPMVVCPCSMGTLSAIAQGASNTLMERAADVALKERRTLVLVTREMPLSAIHLENMLKLARLGVTIMPASPGYYHRPQRVQDVVDFVVARVLDHLGIDQQLVGRWGQYHEE